MCSEDVKKIVKPIAAEVLGFNDDLETMKLKMEEIVKQKEDLTTKLSEALSNDLSDKNKINELTKIIEDQNQNNIAAEYWNNKYPKANIEYTGRTWGPTSKMIPIDVRLLITPQDYHIHEILKANNLYITDGNYEEGIPKIYNYVRSVFYKYKFDENNYSIPEFWEFPFEINEGLKRKLTDGYDCDSWASYLASFYIAAGVPEWMVRVVVGDCDLGGHSTDYIYSGVSQKFHHLNSTYGNKAHTKISDYPTTDDATHEKDRLGISNVWLSYNNQFAWHEFKSYASKDSFKRKGRRLFKITHIQG